MVFTYTQTFARAHVCVIICVFFFIQISRQFKCLMHGQFEHFVLLSFWLLFCVRWSHHISLCVSLSVFLDTIGVVSNGKANNKLKIMWVCVYVCVAVVIIFCLQSVNTRYIICVVKSTMLIYTYILYIDYASHISIPWCQRTGSWIYIFTKHIKNYVNTTNHCLKIDIRKYFN